MIEPINRRVFREYRKALEELRIEHPLQDTYEAVLRGEKSWKDYDREVHEHIFKKGDWDALDVALYHIWRTTRKGMIAGNERAFWQMANKITSYYNPNDKHVKWLLTEIHKSAAKYGKKHPGILEHPEYWQTLTGTTFLEYMRPEDLEETLARIDDAITVFHPNPKKRALLKYPLGLARTIMVLSEELRKREKNLTTSKRKAIAQLSTSAAIRVKTISKLLAREK